MQRSSINPLYRVETNGYEELNKDLENFSKSCGADAGDRFDGRVCIFFALYLTYADILMDCGRNSFSLLLLILRLFPLPSFSSIGGAGLGLTTVMLKKRKSFCKYGLRQKNGPFRSIRKLVRFRSDLFSRRYTCRGIFLAKEIIEDPFPLNFLGCPALV